MKKTEERIRFCGTNNCGGRCPLEAVVKDGTVLRILPSTAAGATEVGEPPLLPCRRGLNYHHTFLSEDRLRYPLRRVGARGEARFARISWEEATETIAAEVRRIGLKYGVGSRYVNYSSGVNALARGDFFAKKLLALDGGYLDRYLTYSSACQETAVPYTYGTLTTENSTRTLVEAGLIILWGHNPLESIFGTETMYRLREAQSRGALLIAVDPRYSRTAAALGAEWIALRPTTDAALVAGMAHTILSEGLQDQEFMDRCCLGFDSDHMPEGCSDAETYADYLYGRRDGIVKNAAWAAAITGVEAARIRWLARLYATVKPAALLPGLGPQRHGNGEQTVRACTLLPCLTGNVGIAGGGAGGGMPAGPPRPRLHTVDNPYAGSIPCFLWTDALTRGHDMTAAADRVRGKESLTSDIKLIFNLAGNTLINQHSDINRTQALLRDTDLCEFIVCSDVLLTPSARFADILLPGTSFFESENIGIPWREGDYLLYCNQVLPPLYESRCEYDWLSEVARHLGHYERFSEGGKTLRELLATAYAEIAGNALSEERMPEFEEFRREGIYRYQHKTQFVAFAEEVCDPERHPFPTPSGKIEIYSPRLEAFHDPENIPALPKYVESFEGPADPLHGRYPLQLIGWHTWRRCHSIHDTNPYLEEGEPHRVWLHPDDAATRGIAEDDLVEVFNERGRLRLRAHLTEDIMPTVAAISQGAWYTPDAEGVDVRGNLNTLTTSRPTPLARGNPQHSNLVQIERCPTDFATPLQ